VVAGGHFYPGSSLLIPPSSGCRWILTAFFLPGRKTWNRKDLLYPWGRLQDPFALIGDGPSCFPARTLRAFRHCPRINGRHRCGNASHQNPAELGCVSLAIVVLKSAYELWSGHVVFEFLHMGMCGQPIAASHAGGIVGGLTAYALFNLSLFRNRKKVTIRCLKPPRVCTCGIIIFLGQPHRHAGTPQPGKRIDGLARSLVPTFVQTGRARCVRAANGQPYRACATPPRFG
jgi:hypothetical protein